MDRFSICLPLTLAYEGGYVDHPRDPGGATNKGITIGTLSDYLVRKATKADVRAISDQTVRDIYRKKYWLAAGCDRYHPGGDLCVFDTSVHSGVSRAVGWAKSIPASVDARSFVSTYCELRLGFLKRLTTWSTFGKGWSRRMADIRAKATTMALASMGVTGGAAKVVLQEEAARSTGKAKADTGKAATAGGGTVVTPGSLAASPDIATNAVSWGLVALVAVILIAVAVFLLIRARDRRNEARAFVAEAETIPLN